jgi:hypothetical protein
MGPNEGCGASQRLRSGRGAGNGAARPSTLGSDYGCRVTQTLRKSRGASDGAARPSTLGSNNGCGVTQRLRSGRGAGNGAARPGALRPEHRLKCLHLCLESIPSVLWAGHRGEAMGVRPGGMEGGGRGEECRANSVFLLSCLAFLFLGGKEGDVEALCESEHVLYSFECGGPQVAALDVAKVCLPRKLELS